MKAKSLLLAMVMIFIATNVMAQTWNCGYPDEADVTATLSNGKMTISGIGAMKDYGWSDIDSKETYPPWNDIKEQIQNVVIENGVTSIGVFAFFGSTSLVDLSIGNTVETIGEGAFYKCSISFLNIPEGVKKIGDKVFADGALTSLVIPKSVVEIGGDAFAYNSELAEISVSWNDPADVKPMHPFEGIKRSSVILHVPVGTKAVYQAAYEWKEFDIVDDGVIITDNHFLSNLTVSAGALSPEFSSYRHTYNVIVPQSVENITLTATPIDGATVSGDGKKELNTGENTFEITANTSQESSVYRVNITRTTTHSLLELVRTTEIVTGATTVTHFDPVVNKNVSTPVIDRYELEYMLTTGNFSGDLPLHFDVGNGQKTYDAVVSVNANSIYLFTLRLNNIGYTQGDITFTTRFDSYGRPTSTTMSYNRRLCNVIASEDNKVLSTEEINIVGRTIGSISVSDLTFTGNGNFAIYTVTFDTQGGNTIAAITVNADDKVTSPADPIRSGYTFGGWYKDASCTNAWNFDTDVVTSNVTLYAKWTAAGPTSYTVTFNTQGGSAVTATTANAGSKVTRPADPTRSGYTFGGWYKEADCTNAWNFDTDIVNSDITLYAKWTESTTGIEIADKPLAKAYPNPTDGLFTLNFDIPGTYQITLTNLAGKVYMRQTIADQEKQVDISSFPAGVYLLTINDGKMQSVTKIMKK